MEKVELNMTACMSVFFLIHDLTIRLSLSPSPLLMLIGLLVAANQEAVHLLDCDVLCLKIAGPCHDLGHGPLGHPFQDDFMKRTLKMNWRHEEASAAIFKYLIKKNNLDLSIWGLTDLDILFIEELSTCCNCGD